jgi:hypothetical protein
MGSGLGYFAPPARIRRPDQPALALPDNREPKGGGNGQESLTSFAGWEQLTNDRADLQARPNRDAVEDRENEGMGVGL